MKNVTYFFILFLLTLTTPLFADKNSNEEVLKRLDRVIDNKTACHVQKEKEIARQMLQRVLPGLSKVLGRDISEDLALEHIRSFILDTQDAESVDAEKEGLIMAEKIIEGSL